MPLFLVAPRASRRRTVQFLGACNATAQNRPTAPELRSLLLRNQGHARQGASDSYSKNQRLGCCG